MSFNCNNCKVTLAHDEVKWGPEEVWKPETNTWGLSEFKPWCAKCADVSGDMENDRDGWDEDEWEDPALTHERERGEAFQDRLDMWRREY
jgi:hypothetical protein